MIKEVIFFNNGNTIAFNENNEQMGDTQQAWIIIFIDYLKKHKVQDIDKIKFVMPDGKVVKYITKYHNWSFV